MELIERMMKSDGSRSATLVRTDETDTMRNMSSAMGTHAVHAICRQQRRGTSEMEQQTHNGVTAAKKRCNFVFFRKKEKLVDDQRTRVGFVCFF
jgi:hypothetical protein